MLEYIILGGCLVFLLIIIALLSTRKEKVKPINLEEIEEHKSPIEEMIIALEKETPERSLTSYEQDQEENAIISYQELVQAVEEKKASMTFTNLEVKKEPVVKEESSIDKINNMMFSEENKIESDYIDPVTNYTEEIVKNVTSENIINETIEIEVEEDLKNFKSSEFISPIFGKDKESEDFLTELKKFRSNL